MSHAWPNPGTLCGRERGSPMPMVRETVVSTMNRAGQVHLAPIGLIAEDEGWIIAPFRPSVTLDNLCEVPFAVANFTDDVRVFAGCLTGRAAQWPTAPCRDIRVPRLANALAHAELAVTHTTEDEQRPRFHCRVLLQCRPRAIPGIQPRQSSRDRGVNSRQPPANAAARQNRARDSLPGNRGQQDRLSG